jgi:hypothetical protein
MSVRAKYAHAQLFQVRDMTRNPAAVEALPDEQADPEIRRRATFGSIPGESSFRKPASCTRHLRRRAQEAGLVGRRRSKHYGFELMTGRASLRFHAASSKRKCVTHKNVSSELRNSNTHIISFRSSAPARHANRPKTIEPTASGIRADRSTDSSDAPRAI